MAPPAAASSSSSPSPAPLNPPSPLLSSSSYLFSHFTPIQEHETETGDHQRHHHSDFRTHPRSTPIRNPTPLHHTVQHNNKTPGRRTKNRQAADDDGSVSCIDCRPHSREKMISVVPLDNNNKHSSFPSSIPSPNVIFKSLLSSLTKKSPAAAAAAGEEEQWKIAVAELSHKLIQTTRTRDNAILEASRLKYSTAELEKQLNKLETYCHSLRSGLEQCSSGNLDKENNIIVDRFLVAVSESRSSVRILSRALILQLSQIGAGKVFDKMSSLLQRYDVKISSSNKTPKAALLYLESLLNRALFEDFETVGFQRSSAPAILNPIERCEANYASFERVKELTWEEVVSKGTRHFSEAFSGFCDRKMSEIVSMLGWDRAWPEQLLQAFFGACKSVWLVHQLANSVHPGLTVFRVDRGVGFDSVYMEDMVGEQRERKLVPTTVRVMVAPGFYLYGSVVKCKVLCRYLANGRNGGVNPSW